MRTILLLSAMLARPASIAGQVPANSTQPEPKQQIGFDVSTIKPSRSQAWNLNYTVNGFSSFGTTLETLVREAYGAHISGVVKGGPAWVSSERFDVEAKVDSATHLRYKDLSYQERQGMLKALLQDRFGLRVHTEARDEKGYALEVKEPEKIKLRNHMAKTGEGSDVKGFDCLAGGPGPVMGHIIATNCTAADLARLLSEPGRKVIDHTGLTARYDFDLQWTPEQRVNNVPGEPAGQRFPFLPRALQQELGLELIQTSVRVDDVVIDQAERPKED